MMGMRSKSQPPHSKHKPFNKCSRSKQILHKTQFMLPIRQVYAGCSLAVNLQWMAQFRRFPLPQSWAVVGENNQFPFALSDHFQCLLVPQHVLSTFHNKLEPRVDRLQRLFLQNKNLTRT